jgi:hypothetical protein
LASSYILAFHLTVSDFALAQISDDMSLDVMNGSLVAAQIVLAAFLGERLVHGVEHLVARQVTGVDGGATNPGFDERVAMVIEGVFVKGTVACCTGVSRCRICGWKKADRG